MLKYIYQDAFLIEVKYLKKSHFIDVSPYIKKRFHQYVGGILAEESKRYSIHRLWPKLY
ncbi:hypothetical protein [Bacillus sp. USDA818B3_A]|uniref:hypothetical protein n=1 Tax=Bacillus sp. USDA818B3_A TaxID=2698834 RepID=UPI00136CCEF6|nr:hypothetical protein [Bacillus sp. USDA818B3_A]